MADIELVIKIPEEEYDLIVNDEACGLNVLTRAIAKGILLPKGHGRLIDADALKKDDEVTEWLSLNAVRTGKMLKRFSELFIKKIDVTPTIIEADKGKSEEDEIIFNNLCNSCSNIGCEFQSGIVRTKCAFYMPPQIESDSCGNYIVMHQQSSKQTRKKVRNKE